MSSHTTREYAGIKNADRTPIAGSEQGEGSKRAVQMFLMLGEAGTAADATTTTPEGSARCAGNYTFRVRDGR
jgi:hypothetical protein